jgi:hypothetical protein
MTAFNGRRVRAGIAHKAPAYFPAEGAGKRSLHIRIMHVYSAREKGRDFSVLSFVQKL